MGALLRYNISHVLEAAPFALLAGAVYLLLRRRYLRSLGRAGKTPRSETVRLLLVCYLAGLFALVWTPGGFWSDLWLWLRFGWPMRPVRFFDGVYDFRFSVPRLVRYMFRAENGWLRSGLLGNVLLCVPLGLLAPLVQEAPRCDKTVLTGLGLSVIIELVQPLFGRACDVDDMLTNTLGALAGYLLFRIVRALLPETVRRLREE